MGWYHSHPFDVEVHSHCFLSSTDISTQLSWQRAEDPHGNPWLAIVVSLIALKIVLFSAGFASKAVYHALFSSSETQCCTTVVDSKREIRRPLYRAGHNVLARSLRCGLLVCGKLPVHTLTAWCVVPADFFDLLCTKIMLPYRGVTVLPPLISGGPPAVSGEVPAGVRRIPGVPPGVQRASERDTGRQDRDG